MKTMITYGTQFVLASMTLFGVLLAVDVGSGHSIAESWPSTLAWALIAAAIFTGSRYMRRGQDCAVCDSIKPK
jgi:hypothetical protein